MRREQLERDDSLERYKNAYAAGIAAKIAPDTLNATLFGILEKHEQSNLSSGRSRLAMRNAQDANTLNVTVRVQVFLWQKRLSEALALVQTPVICEVSTLRDLAMRLDDQHAGDAVKLLQRVFDAVMPGAGTPYTEEARLVKEIAQRMQPERRATWLETVRAQYKAKRNFIRDIAAF